MNNGVTIHTEPLDDVIVVETEEEFTENERRETNLGVEMKQEITNDTQVIQPIESYYSQVNIKEEVEIIEEPFESQNDNLVKEEVQHYEGAMQVMAHIGLSSCHYNTISKRQMEIEDHQVNTEQPDMKKSKGEKVPQVTIKKQKSTVWKLFKYKKSEGVEDSVNKKIAVCQVCGLEMKCHGGTSSLKNHLERKHPKKWFNVQSGSTITMNKCVHSPASWKRNGQNSKVFDRYLARFVISANLPLSIVENEWLKKLVRPEYNLPSRKFLGYNVLGPMAEDTKSYLELKLQKADALGLTTDHYTSSSHYPFGNLYATIINEDFQIESFNLGTFPFNMSHSVENIYESIEGKEGILANWGLQDVPRTYITDNTSNCKIAFANNEVFALLGCLGHTIHLIVREGLKVQEVQHQLAQLKNIVKYFLTSTKGHLLLKDNEEWLGFPDLTVPSEGPTRWNSFIKSGKRLLQIRDHVAISLRESERIDLLFTSSDWSLLNDLVNYLQDFHDATNTVSGATYPTITMFLPILIRFKNITDPNKPLPFHIHHKEIIAEVRKAMFDNLEGRYAAEKVSNLLQVAACLDPRNMISNKYSTPEAKHLLIEATHKIQFRYTQEEQSQSQFNCTEEQELENTLTILHQSTSSAPPPLTSTSTMPNPLQSRDVNHDYVHSLFDYDDDEGDNDPDTLKEKVTSEVESYFIYFKTHSRTSIISDKNKFDLLAWWREKSSLYPYLSLTAKNYLCITATSVNSENAFSSTNNITKLQNQLSSRTVQTLAFLRSNSEYIPSITQVTDVDVTDLSEP
ncbi:unnamed protein product, partial [Meganyctiphanes norvegica]|uniref:BED-type domain-containing protein n=1 Tax=Meganyctiphanes norvegica TaxID=48144 RepID=A0AAV2QKY3_MEGNR